MSAFPLIIGHRGASAHAPENTIAALKLALDSGADGVEFDVRLAADGVPVVIHDMSLRRTGRRTERVSRLTSRELSAIDVGSWFNRRHPTQADDSFAGECVPTLEAAMDLLRTSAGPIFVELKTDDQDTSRLAAAVCEIVRAYGQAGRVIIKSFDLAAISQVRREAPELQTAALFSLRFHPITRQCKYMFAAVAASGAHQLSLHRALATQRTARLAAAAGMPVTVWTVDQPRWIYRSRELGIRNLITNDPATMAKARKAADLNRAVVASEPECE